LYPENPFDDAKIQQSKGDLQIGFPAWGVQPLMREIEFGKVVQHVRPLHFQSQFLGCGEALRF
jgi:hypothetical protein